MMQHQQLGVIVNFVIKRFSRGREKCVFNDFLCDFFSVFPNRVGMKNNKRLKSRLCPSERSKFGRRN